MRDHGWMNTSICPSDSVVLLGLEHAGVKVESAISYTRQRSDILECRHRRNAKYVLKLKSRVVRAAEGFSPSPEMGDVKEEETPENDVVHSKYDRRQARLERWVEREPALSVVVMALKACKEHLRAVLSY